MVGAISGDRPGRAETVTAPPLGTGARVSRPKREMRLTFPACCFVTHTNMTLTKSPPAPPLPLCPTPAGCSLARWHCRAPSRNRLQHEAEDRESPARFLFCPVTQSLCTCRSVSALPRSDSVSVLKKQKKRALHRHTLRF